MSKRPKVIGITHKKKHEPIEGRQTVCDECRKDFKCPSKFDRHYKEVHEKEKLFWCTKCSLKFARREHLSKHMFHMHMGSKFSCHLCGDSIATLSDIRPHMEGKHSMLPTDDNCCSENMKRDSGCVICISYMRHLHQAGYHLFPQRPMKKVPGSSKDGLLNIIPKIIKAKKRKAQSHRGLARTFSSQRGYEGTLDLSQDRSRARQETPTPEVFPRSDSLPENHQARSSSANIKVESPASSPPLPLLFESSQSHLISSYSSYGDQRFLTKSQESSDPAFVNLRLSALNDCIARAQAAIESRESDTSSIEIELPQEEGYIGAKRKVSIRFHRSEKRAQKAVDQKKPLLFYPPNLPQKNISDFTGPVTPPESLGTEYWHQPSFGCGVGQPLRPNIPEGWSPFGSGGYNASPQFRPAFAMSQPQARLPPRHQSQGWSQGPSRGFPQI